MIKEKINRLSFSSEWVRIRMRMGRKVRVGRPQYKVTLPSTARSHPHPHSHHSPTFTHHPHPHPLSSSPSSHPFTIILTHPQPQSQPHPHPPNNIDNELRALVDRIREEIDGLNEWERLNALLMKMG
jgi:hypothetical protein